MKKSQLEQLNASLDKALAPPKQRPRQNLDALLDEYDDEQGHSASPKDATAKRAEPTPRTPPTPRTARTPRTVPTPATSDAPISPVRDFTKVANSIVREAVAGGHFTGKSKQLYDCLYALTRGAVVPKRSVTIPKPELMKRSGIGSERTLLKNVAHLKSLRLVEVSYTDGKHGGNEYAVNLPEEVGLRAEPAPRTPPTPPTADTARHARQEVPPVPPAESGVRGVGSAPVESTTSDESKTSYKTKDRSDDEPAALFEVFRQAERELTGKNSARGEQWRELAEVIVAELKIAAARTTVSNVPAFLAEHLRRRLWKLDKRQAQEQGRELPDQAPSAPSESAQDCPDCKGSGWWYPDGQEKGVAKCRHERRQVKD